MKKVVGYIVAGAGLAVMALGFNIIKFKLAFLDGVASNYIAGAGVVMVIVGVVMGLKGSVGGKIRKAVEEVPIYEGIGKKRKIVGYRKD